MVGRPPATTACTLAMEAAEGRRRLRGLRGLLPDQHQRMRRTRARSGDPDRLAARHGHPLRRDRRDHCGGPPRGSPPPPAPTSSPSQPESGAMARGPARGRRGRFKRGDRQRAWPSAPEASPCFQRASATRFPRPLDRPRSFTTVSTQSALLKVMSDGRARKAARGLKPRLFGELSEPAGGQEGAPPTSSPPPT